jgi:hypothetical protein
VRHPGGIDGREPAEHAFGQVGQLGIGEHAHLAPACRDRDGPMGQTLHASAQITQSAIRQKSPVLPQAGPSGARRPSYSRSPYIVQRWRQYLMQARSQGSGRVGVQAGGTGGMRKGGR